MDVTFERTGERRYGVTVAPEGGERLTMHPAPGYDPHLPHDLVHYLVEAHWGLRNGIYGQLAAGGNAGTFRPADTAHSKTWRRHIERRNSALRKGGSDMERSELLAALALPAWLRRRRERGDTTLPAQPVEGPSPVSRAEALEAAGATPRELDGVLDRMDAAAARWNTLDVGGSVTFRWG